MYYVRMHNEGTKTIFCYICKRHVPVIGATAKDRLEMFHASGHSDTKVKALKKGQVGV